MSVTWRSTTTSHSVSSKVVDDGSDDWETDPDFVVSNRARNGQFFN